MHMPKRALGVRAFSQALKEGALGNKTFVIDVQKRTVFPVHALSTKPMLADFGLLHTMLCNYMALRTTVAERALSDLKILTDFTPLLDDGAICHRWNEILKREMRVFAVMGVNKHGHFFFRAKKKYLLLRFKNTSHKHKLKFVKFTNLRRIKA